MLLSRDLTQTPQRSEFRKVRSVVISFPQMGKTRVRKVRRAAKFSEPEMSFQANDPRVYTPSHNPSWSQMRKLQWGGAHGIAEGCSKSPGSPVPIPPPQEQGLSRQGVQACWCLIPTWLSALGHRTVVCRPEAKKSLYLCKVRCEQDTSGHLTGTAVVTTREQGLGFSPCLSPRGALRPWPSHCPSLGLGVLTDKGQGP